MFEFIRFLVASLSAYLALLLHRWTPVSQRTNSISDPTTTQTSPLLRLPLELKEEVYKYLLPTCSLVSIPRTTLGSKVRSCAHSRRWIERFCACCVAAGDGQPCFYDSLGKCCRDHRIELSMFQISRQLRADLTTFLLHHNTIFLRDHHLELISRSLELQTLIKPIRGVALVTNFRRTTFFKQLRSESDKAIRKFIMLTPNVKEISIVCETRHDGVGFEFACDKREIMTFSRSFSRWKLDYAWLRVQAGPEFVSNERSHFKQCLRDLEEKCNAEMLSSRSPATGWSCPLLWLQAFGNR